MATHTARHGSSGTVPLFSQTYGMWGVVRMGRFQGFWPPGFSDRVRLTICGAGDTAMLRAVAAECGSLGHFPCIAGRRRGVVAGPRRFPNL